MRNLILSLIILILIILVGSWEFRITERERLQNIPDVVYEHIYLKLGDGCSDTQILEYYDRHRAECDKIELEDF